MGSLAQVACNLVSEFGCKRVHFVNELLYGIVGWRQGVCPAAVAQESSKTQLGIDDLPVPNNSMHKVRYHTAAIQ